MSLRTGTAVVYQASDVSTGESVAIKAMLLKGGSASLPTAAAREGAR